LLLIALVIWAPALVHAQDQNQDQERADLSAKLARIFESEDFKSATFGPARWLDGGDAYTTLEPSESVEGARDIVRYETATGEREVLVPASARIPERESAGSPLEVNDYQWSQSRKRLLIFTNTVRVWRENTRGDYWVLELESGSLRKLGGVAAESSLMFAKLSPDGSKVAYVTGNNLYVENLSTGEVIALTSDGSPTTIYGTSDWVYEEEFRVRDGFRWSPDGKRIAFWNFDATGIEAFTLINNTDSLYPSLIRIPYPKAGTTNSAVRIGVINALGDESEIVWMDVPGDPRNTYIARMVWAGNDEIVLQHLNRLQNQNDILLANATSGMVSSFHQDRNDAWVEVMDEMEWRPDQSELLWLSERDGYRHAYTVARDGSGERLVTRFGADVIQSLGIGPDGEWYYFLASPDDATSRYLYRASVDGSSPPVRLTPQTSPGTNTYDLSPDARWAFHTHSRFDEPPRVDLVALPDHRVVRTLEANARLRENLAGVLTPPVERFEIDIGEATLDAWMLKPRDFDPEKKYPLLVYVYGEPAGQTVLDRWFGARSLFHRALADEGFLVASFDNRGTPAPKGAAWRKVVYGAVGDLSSRDQAAAVRALSAARSYVDGSRVAIWGWSGGGSNTLNAMFRFPDVFHVGVSVAPVPDQRLYDTIYQERYMGLPQDNEEGYRLGSPINFAEGLKGKLLLIHGTGDDNVHYQGTERLIDRLIELGKPFDLMVYPNRSHAIREGEGTTLHVYSLISRYLIQTGWLD
jgi:dipeptidyl-peptidase-4